MSAEIKAMLGIGGTLLLAVVSLHIYLSMKIDALGGHLTDASVRVVQVEDRIARVEEKITENNDMLRLLIENIVDDPHLPDAARK